MTSDSKTHTELSTLGRPSWDDTWINQAEVISQRSLCSRAKVGCAAVDEEQHVLAMTYNGPPPGYEAEGECINWCPRAQGVGAIGNDYSNCPSNHAEMNAVARMPRTPGRAVTVYINRLCCSTCAKALAAAGVTRIVCRKTDIDGHLGLETTLTYLSDCGVAVDFME